MKKSKALKEAEAMLEKIRPSLNKKLRRMAARFDDGEYPALAESEQYERTRTT